MKDIKTGIVTGSAQIIVGYPLDTIKTLIQNKNMWKNLKFIDYYRGAHYRLPLAISKNSIIFPSHKFAKKYINSDIIAGGFAGLVVSPVQYFFDVIKIKKQTLKPLNLSSFTNNYGKYSVLNKEILGMSAYFSSYHYLKEKNYSPFISGSLAGIMSWLTSYPLDTIRSRQISQNINMYEAIKMGQLFNGLIPCLIRAALTNGAIWTIVEKMKK